MNKSEKILREYAYFKDINQSEPIELLPLTIQDCMEEYANEIEKKETQLKEANELLKSIFVKEHISNVGWDWECNEYFKKYIIKI